MSGRVWLVRHASTDWTGRRWCGSTDLALNATGRLEAKRLAVRLATLLPSDISILSSPLRRAVETADRLAAATGRVSAIDRRLREVDFGSAEGLDWSGLSDRHPELARDIAAGKRSIDWPGGESAAAVRDRAARLWRDVGSHDADVALVSHGGLIRALLGVALEDGGHVAALPYLAPASSMELRRVDDGWIVT